jgi:hypothetical protein
MTMSTTVADALDRFREHSTRVTSFTPFRLVSSVLPTDTRDVAAEWAGAVLPPDAIALWSACGGARLFEDIDYGQWGLVLLDARESHARTQIERTRRRTEFRADDVVIGTFLGDQELLVLAPSEADARRLLVALPLDSRSDWFAAGSDLGEFLKSYLDACGEKFWEGRLS